MRPGFHLPFLWGSLDNWTSRHRAANFIESSLVQGYKPTQAMGPLLAPGALNDCFKAGAGRTTTSEANDRNRFEIPNLRGLDFARPVYFSFFPVG